MVVIVSACTIIVLSWIDDSNNTSHNIASVDLAEPYRIVHCKALIKVKVHSKETKSN